MASNLDRLYTDLTALTGISRTRDVRLERIAADRALEMRHQQGLFFDPNDPIQHQFDQLRARIYPFQPVDGSTENNTWHYYPPQYVDPIDAAVGTTFTMPDEFGQEQEYTVGWWNSAPHKSQLMDTRYTHWGHGIHFEDMVSGSRRWYFVTVFARDMEPLQARTIEIAAGKLIGFHLTADGQAIHKETRSFSSPRAGAIDDRMNVPGRGPMVHMATTPMKNYWLPDDGKITWVNL